MKNYRIKVAAIIICIIGCFAMLGVAGDIDYCDQVILHMDRDQYDWIRDTLTRKHGHQPSDRDIAHWWGEHHNEMP